MFNDEVGVKGPGMFQMLVSVEHTVEVEIILKDGK